MCGAREWQDCEGRGQWSHETLGIGSLLLTLICLLSCTRTHEPQQTFEQVRQTFVHGDLIRSQKEAEKYYNKFIHSSPEWAWKFRVLEGETLMWQGMSEKVLALLGSERPPSNWRDLTILTLTLEGLAHAHLHEFGKAEIELVTAEQLCATSTEATCGEVIRAQGILAWERGQIGVAHHDFDRTLAFALTRKDRFLEATALLNLGAANLYEQHFDEAINMLGAASQLSTTLDAGNIQLNALGNLGWAHYKLGDSEKALGFFVDAEKQAAQLGSFIDEVVWLTTTGYVYLDAKNFPIAEQFYQKALNLATQINSKEDIINASISLALLSEETGKFDQAIEYADRAITRGGSDGNRLDELYPLLVKGRVYADRYDSTNAERVFLEVAQDPKSDVSLKWEAEHELARLYETENQTTPAEREYRESLSTFETARSSLQHEESELPFLTNASRIYDDYIHFLVTQGKTDRALQVADYSRARTLAEGLGFLQKGTSFSPSALNAQDVARRAGGTILFYSLGEKQSYLWAITSQKTSLYPLPPSS